MFMQPLTAAGLKFDDTFVERQVRMLTQFEQGIRSQLGLLLPYVAIMRALTRVKAQDVPKSKDQLKALSQLDIPRFSAFSLLTALRQR
jgi:hypothetical protein